MKNPVLGNTKMSSRKMLQIGAIGYFCYFFFVNRKGRGWGV
jgi:hypothetical protein